MIDDLIVIAILLLIIGGAIAYIVIQKKKGVRCIGCRESGCCAAKAQADNITGCGGNCACCCNCKANTQ